MTKTIIETESRAKRWFSPVASQKSLPTLRLRAICIGLGTHGNRGERRLMKFITASRDMPKVPTLAHDPSSHTQTNTRLCMRVPPACHSSNYGRTATALNPLQPAISFSRPLRPGLPLP